METELPRAARAVSSDPMLPARRSSRLTGISRWQRWAAGGAAVAVIAAGTGWALSSGSSAPPAPSAPSSAAARTLVGQATALVTQAGSAMSQGMSALHSLPTVTTVSAVVDPYLVSLQRYEAVLAGARLTGSAATWRGMVLLHVRDLVTLLHSLPTTPSFSLGTWINGFYLQTAELQSAIEGLLPTLRTPPA